MLINKKDHTEEKEEDSNEGEAKEDGLPDEEDREEDMPFKKMTSKEEGQ